jgi:hypothetical protein
MPATLSLKPPHEKKSLRRCSNRLKNVTETYVGETGREDVNLIQVAQVEFQ